MNANGESCRIMIAAGGDSAHRHGQRPPEEGTLACHRQGGADPAGLQTAEHPLQEEMGGPAMLGAKNL
ncbi:hypothetical protein NDU88_001954 [Pleurodeles waltl]|uniref:Uncharacterized protein n=1 Tax=Pleurodeles waltl TaxID=8319 RepID=A0AAV7WQ76_PLEWA|nr:hypothetical protein NDU88_001954 [Pleurodeles waltl]